MSVYNKRQERYLAGSFNSLGNHALVMGACAGCASWDNLASLGYELGSISPQNHLLIVHAFGNGLFCAKHTDFATWFPELTRFAGRPATRWWRHLLSFPFSMYRSRVTKR